MTEATATTCTIGPFGFNSADGTIPLYVDDKAVVELILELSAMSEQDELAHYGGIDDGVYCTHEDEDDVTIYVTLEGVRAAIEAAEQLWDEEEFDEDTFLEIWQGLGLC